MNMEDLRRILKSKGGMELGMGAVQVPRVFPNPMSWFEYPDYR